MSEQGVKFGDLSPAEQERLKMAWRYGYVIEWYWPEKCVGWGRCRSEPSWAMGVIYRISDELPPCWKDLTDEQKGKLLLAHQEGKVIEFFTPLAGGWRECPTPHWSGNYCYRVKMEPVEKREG